MLNKLPPLAGPVDASGETLDTERIKSSIEEHSTSTILALIAEIERLRAAAVPSPPAQEPVTTFTPLMWMSMTEEQRYEEYIRVRNLTALIDLSAPSPSAGAAQEKKTEG